MAIISYLLISWEELSANGILHVCDLFALGNSFFVGLGVIKENKRQEIALCKGQKASRRIISTKNTERAVQILDQTAAMMPCSLSLVGVCAAGPES